MFVNSVSATHQKVTYLRLLFRPTSCCLSASYRKSVEAELTELLDLNQRQIEAMEAAQRKEDKEDKLEDEASLDIYCSVDELREKVNQYPTRNSTFVRNSINRFDNNSVNPMADKRDALQEISLNKVSLAWCGSVFVLGTHDIISGYCIHIGHSCFIWY